MAAPVLLAMIASLAVYLGLLPGLQITFSERLKGAITSFSTGALLYLLVKLASRITRNLSDLASAAINGYPTWPDFWIQTGIFIAGLALSLLGMLFYESRFIRRGKDMMFPADQAKKASLLIALGFGFFHFSQGMALGAEYTWHEFPLMALMAAAFILFNASEGLWVAVPLFGNRQGLLHLVSLGAVMVIPAVLGAGLSVYMAAKSAEMLALSLVTGFALFYVGSLFRLGKTLKAREEPLVGTGLLAGFVIGFFLEIMLMTQFRVY